MSQNRMKSTKYTKITLILLAGWLLLTAIVPAAAEDYRFEVPSAEVIFWVASDGNASISYQYTFKNEGKGLDYIDIGLPNDNYDLSKVEATIDGQKVSQKKLSRADYSESGLRHGVTIDNTASPIPSGSSAEVYLYVPSVGALLYDSSEEITENVPYVGFQFQPNYFSSSFAQGNTDYTLRLVLPVGMSETEPYYITPTGWPGDTEPKSYFTPEKNVGYEWHSENADASTLYTFGALFPKSILSSQDQITAAGGTVSSGQDSEENSGDDSGSLSICLGALVMLIVCIVLINKFKKNSYLPPKINTDGEGIKRGLTAVEASVLLEKDLSQVMTMIMFSLCKKGVVSITSKDPLEFEIKEPIPDELYDYEKNFIEAARKQNKDKRRELMKQTIHRLILSVTNKMKGFNSKETKAYYESICAKAWDQVEKAGTPDLRGELLDQNFGWAMLDNDPEKKVETVFKSDPVYVPSWWWRMDPTWHSYGNSSQPVTVSGVPASGSVSPSKSGGSGSSMPTLPGSDFARSITGSMRGVGEAMVGSLAAFTNEIRGITNPAPAPSSSSNRHSGSGGGGGSCACACACASCACACAGGGR